jgi:hypothetical protein
MLSWSEFGTVRPDLVEAGGGLLYQFGVGLAFLATVRLDGGPRVHPMCPILSEGGLYALLVPSPKRNDLLRDPRFSLHSFPCDDNEDAFYVTGEARPVEEALVRDAVIATYLAERRDLAMTSQDLRDQLLFAFEIETCLLSRTAGHGDPEARHVVWHASAHPAV